ncbi:MAG: hypothetical protein MOB07_31060 [Acidobacteria bacterium]|nr:hypothetical protein [Acidobacteriota bacterium]
MRCTDHIPDPEYDREQLERFGTNFYMSGRPCVNEAVIVVKHDECPDDPDYLCRDCAQRTVDRWADYLPLAAAARDIAHLLRQI